MRKKVIHKNELVQVENKNAPGRKMKILLFGDQKNVEKNEPITSQLDSQRDILFATLGRIKTLEKNVHLEEYKIFEQEVEYWKKFYPEWVEEYLIVKKPSQNKKPGA